MLPELLGDQTIQTQGAQVPVYFAFRMHQRRCCNAVFQLCDPGVMSWAAILHYADATVPLTNAVWPSVHHHCAVE